MTAANHQNRDGRRARSLRSVLSNAVNFPVLLSLLFVVQLVPVEHLHCLFAGRQTHAMDSRCAMTKGVQIISVDEGGCCPGAPAPQRKQDSSRVEPCCTSGREQTPPVLLKRHTGAHLAEMTLPPGISILEGPGSSDTGPPVKSDYGPFNLHVLNATFLI